MKRLIVTADDFGRSLPINEAVEDSHSRGILTAASLMVAGEAADDAVERARRRPTLAVGLHATLIDGLPVLPPAKIPDLVGRDGRFTDRPVSFGTRLYLDRGLKLQAERELQAQFESFRITGLPLGHVDAHHHYQLHPTVFDLLLGLAVEYGAPALRVPWEPPFVTWRPGRRQLVGRLVGSVFHWPTTRRMRRRIERAGLIANDRIFGMNDSGAMDAACLDHLLGALPDGLTEIYCHPATQTWTRRPMPPHYRCADEYAALIDPLIAAAVQRHGIRLTSFAAEAAGRNAP